LRTEVVRVEQRQGLAAGGKTGETIAKTMLEKFPNGVKVTSTASNRVNANVDRTVFYKVAEFLKNEMDFEHVTSVSGVDWFPENRMQAVFHITSYSNCVTAEIVVDLPRDDPEVDSISPRWGGAN
jgi:NADH-quinone oxidoreductase subunit C